MADLVTRLRDCAEANEFLRNRSLAVLLSAAADEIERLRSELGSELSRRGPTVADAGARGGKARAAKLTAQQRSAQARNAVNARWAKRRAEQGA